MSAVKKSWRSKDPAYKAWVGLLLQLLDQYFSVETATLVNVLLAMQESSSSVKICLGVDNVKELLTLRDQARDAGKYCLALIC